MSMAQACPLKKKATSDEITGLITIRLGGGIVKDILVIVMWKIKQNFNQHRHIKQTG